MFEFRLHILGVGEGSFLGIVEGFPEILVHATSPERVEAGLMTALVEHLKRLQDREATRIDWDDFPTIGAVRLQLNPSSN